ncbi:hypothetical protein TNCV_2642571 [Trichonephila clavipes]|nr:hypothetical protein TNCV_2642571 [Trichonephila clavipes]
MHRPPYTAGLSCYWARTHDTPATIRYLDHLATMVTSSPFTRGFCCGHPQDFQTHCVLTSTYSVCTLRVFGGIGHRTQTLRFGGRCSNH